MMLRLLEVRNLALIDNLSFYPGAGLNVISGETGAGKSLLVGALELLLGGRAGAEAVRFGADGALLQAVFAGNLPEAEQDEETFCPAADKELILGRELRAGGPNICRINGRVQPLVQLAALGQKLVDLHGQHQQQSLLSGSVQRRLLDAYGGPQLAASLQELAEVHRERSATQKLLDELGGDDAELERKADFLRYQLAEITAAALTSDEEESLGKRFKKLSQAQRLRERTAKIYAELCESTYGAAIMDRLGEVAKELTATSALDEDLACLAEQVAAAMQELAEVARELRDYHEGLELDEAELQQVVERLEIYKKMKKKYGTTVAEVTSLAQQIKKDLALLEGRKEKVVSAARELQLLDGRLWHAAGVLSERRREAADILAKEIGESLQSLALRGARLHIALEAVGVINAHGQDKIEFLFSANSGEPLKPLSKVASGGEIARVMLAVKSVLAAQDNVPTLIFDEIDAGIGGLTVRAVAEKLRLLSRHRQVICVTHQPLIAAAADHHFQIFKREEEGRTVTGLAELSGADRERELARMLGGDAQNQAALEHAREMLNTVRAESD